MASRKIPARQGIAWSAEEDARVCEEFAEDVSIKDIAVRHQRTDGAIRSRLVKLNLISIGGTPIIPSITPSSKSTCRRDSQIVEVTAEQVLQQVDPYNSDGSCLKKMPADAKTQPETVVYIDRLISDLQNFRSVLEKNIISSKLIHKRILYYFSNFDNALFKLNYGMHDAVIDDGHEGSPLPDRLREAVDGLIKACVRDQDDRYVAIQVLGLDGDGHPLRLCDIGTNLGVTRQRISQRWARALARIRSGAPRAIASRQRLQAVMQIVSAETDWTAPQQTAHQIIRLLSDNVSVVRNLTLICCLAAGWLGKTKDLASQADEMAVTECRKASTDTRIQLDVWKNASMKAFFPGPVIHFDKAPVDLRGRKREPGATQVGDMLFHQSDKLDRAVACESGVEYRVIRWLEKTPDVVWYQEQPVRIPYTLNGENRSYYPDVAALDAEGRLYIIEVKPVFYMYRVMTLIKAIACMDYVAKRGMGFLLVDDYGRTVIDYASTPYDSHVADEVNVLIDKYDQIPFKMVRTIFEENNVKMSISQFITMVINRDWSVTQSSGVMVGRLRQGLSFKPLLDHLPRW